MSFDLNLEVYILPFKEFTPYVYAGGGYIRQNDKRLDGQSFTDTKAQGGAGVELLVSEVVGIKLFAEYNIMSSDDLDGIVSGDSNDGFWRGGFGINYYFGNNEKSKKIKKDVPTFIKSKQIENKD
jgi:curli production assembly/transport component CsgG